MMCGRADEFSNIASEHKTATQTATQTAIGIVVLLIGYDIRKGKANKDFLLTLCFSHSFPQKRLSRLPALIRSTWR